MYAKSDHSEILTPINTHALKEKQMDLLKQNRKILKKMLSKSPLEQTMQDSLLDALMKHW